MLEAKGLKKYYGELEVLKGVDLQIEKGEVVSIVGDSGAGKSTLLHLLGTLDQPDEGILQLDGINYQSLRKNKLADFRNTHIGFVFQSHNLLPEFTALENVCLPGFLGGRKEKEVRKRAEELLQLLKLDHRLSHKPSTLSGGEQQRVSVARSLINNPKIVFADEPSGNLDSKNGDSVMQLLAELNEQGVTICMVTHDSRYAHFAKRTVNLFDGQIVSSADKNKETKLNNAQPEHVNQTAESLLVQGA